MVRTKALRAVPTAQLLAILVLSLAIYLIVDYGKREAADYHVTQAEKRAMAQIEAELALRQELLARKEYVTTREYVERWARGDAHMILPGDQPVILVMVDSPSGTAPLVQPVETRDAMDRPTPNWYEWWKLFFDSVPGAFAAG